MRRFEADSRAICIVIIYVFAALAYKLCVAMGDLYVSGSTYEPEELLPLIWHDFVQPWSLVFLLGACWQGFKLPVDVELRGHYWPFVLGLLVCAKCSYRLFSCHHGIPQLVYMGKMGEVNCRDIQETCVGFGFMVGMFFVLYPGRFMVSQLVRRRLSWATWARFERWSAVLCIAITVVCIAISYTVGHHRGNEGLRELPLGICDRDCGVCGETLAPEASASPGA